VSFRLNESLLLARAMEALTNTKQGANQERWQRVAKDRALDPILDRVTIETQ
jgi:hypothetical protein